MRHGQIKPVSYVRAHAADILRDLSNGGQPLLITQNGEARAVLQDIASYEKAQETLALLKLLALGRRDMEADRTVDARDAVVRLRDAARG